MTKQEIDRYVEIYSGPTSIPYKTLAEEWSNGDFRAFIKGLCQKNFDGLDLELAPFFDKHIKMSDDKCFSLIELYPKVFPLIPKEFFANQNDAETLYRIYVSSSKSNDNLSFAINKTGLHKFTAESADSVIEKATTVEEFEALAKKIEFEIKHSDEKQKLKKAGAEVSIFISLLHTNLKSFGAELKNIPNQMLLSDFFYRKLISICQDRMLEYVNSELKSQSYYEEISPAVQAKIDQKLEKLTDILQDKRCKAINEAVKQTGRKVYND